MLPLRQTLLEQQPELQLSGPQVPAAEPHEGATASTSPRAAPRANALKERDDVMVRLRGGERFCKETAGQSNALTGLEAFASVPAVYCVQTQALAAEAEFRGVGLPLTKSFELLFESVHANGAAALFARNSASVLDTAPAGVPSEQFAAP